MAKCRVQRVRVRERHKVAAECGRPAAGSLTFRWGTRWSRPVPACSACMRQARRTQGEKFIAITRYEET